MSSYDDEISADLRLFWIEKLTKKDESLDVVIYSFIIYMISWSVINYGLSLIVSESFKSILHFTSIPLSLFLSYKLVREIQRETRMKLHALKDDAIKAQYDEMQSSNFRRKLIIGAAGVALLFGLLFTQIGHDILNSLPI